MWLLNIKHVTPALMAINECQIKARSALKAQSSNKRNGSSNVLFFVHEPIINNYKSLIYYRKVFLFVFMCLGVAWINILSGLCLFHQSNASGSYL